MISEMIYVSVNEDPCLKSIMASIDSPKSWGTA
ncbi:hypothetical protein LOK49_LG12G02547 [Camellia lanceoleosa]|uniref:Uncharacterized protein n=1 Tax=Camellia lanceoleosa TaxID=1840588 RepID=A0ACC0FXG7_9ERIC|nr:hypothetical protein LOK49_LG12G02547 [Camellia lanceoleosa]